MAGPDPFRRAFLKAGLAGACSLAAHPFLTTVTLAQSNGARPLGDNRLVVIILRGAMDGLDVIRPIGDPGYAALRPGLLKAGPGLAAGDFWALHPALEPLVPLWDAGQLGFVHATSTPYRNKRSHFAGQDLLEAGTGTDLAPEDSRDGWLNRLLQVVPGVESETAWSVGVSEMPVLAGDAPFAAWAPDQRLRLGPQGRRLLELAYADDPVFHAAAEQAIELSGELAAEAAAEAAMAEDDEGGDDMMMAEPAAKPGKARFADDLALAEFAAGRLSGPARIAAFSLSGWDTHRGQATALPGALTRLGQVILTLRAGLGANWDRTAVLAMTEFGRTARENGTAGTDHGTGGAMLLAGGAIRGQRIWGDWPGLSDAALYEGRDLMPTTDVRVWAGHALRGLFGIDRDVISQTVFPGIDLPRDPGLIL